jgi:hypothetical protein
MRDFIVETQLGNNLSQHSLGTVLSVLNVQVGPVLIVRLLLSGFAAVSGTNLVYTAHGWRRRN